MQYLKRYQVHGTEQHTCLSYPISILQSNAQMAILLFPKSDCVLQTCNAPSRMWNTFQKPTFTWPQVNFVGCASLLTDSLVPCLGFLSAEFVLITASFLAKAFSPLICSSTDWFIYWIHINWMATTRRTVSQVLRIHHRTKHGSCPQQVCSQKQRFPNITNVPAKQKGDKV